MYKSMLESDLPITIATKYPKQTLEYFCKKGKNVNLVKLYGSIELAPLVNLLMRLLILFRREEL